MVEKKPSGKGNWWKRFNEFMVGPRYTDYRVSEGPTTPEPEDNE